MSDTSPRIAIIDTDPVFCNKLEDRIESHGWQTCTSNDLRRVAGFVARTEPDLVIIDMGQGRERVAAWHALDVLKRARETCDIPVVICSAAPSVLRTQARILREYGVVVTSQKEPPSNVLRRVIAVLQRRRVPKPWRRR